MTDVTSPGQDFYDALRAELREAPRSTRADLLWALDDDVSRAEWHLLPVAMRSVFNGAALRFLSE